METRKVTLFCRQCEAMFHHSAGLPDGPGKMPQLCPRCNAADIKWQEEVRPGFSQRHWHDRSLALR